MKDLNRFHLPQLHPMGLYVNMGKEHHMRIDKTGHIVAISDDLEWLRETTKSTEQLDTCLSGWHVLEKIAKKDRSYFTRIHYKDNPADELGKMLIRNMIHRLQKPKQDQHHCP